MAANCHSRPATLSHTRPRNAWRDGISSHAWLHLATLRPRLILKQVTGAPVSATYDAIARICETYGRFGSTSER
jgi:hypothetical protein